MLGIVTCYYNPCGYRNIRHNYFRFRQALQQPLITVELSFNGRFEIEEAIQLRGTDCHLMWQKERLLNIAIEALPDRYDKVAWIDADILFMNSDWYRLAEQALENVPVIQLGDRAVSLDAAGRGETVLETFASAWSRGAIVKKPHQWFHTGLAWACRRDLIAEEGLYDDDILGGADVSMACSWVGWLNHRNLITRFTPGMWEPYLRWARVQAARTQQQLGCVRGDLCHLWHGSHPERRYVERKEWLRQHNFDPTHDLMLDQNGLWKWNSPKTEMHRLVADYFSLRNEDSQLQEAQTDSILVPTWLAPGQPHLFADPVAAPVAVSVPDSRPVRRNSPPPHDQK